MEFALSTSTKPQIKKHYSIGKEMMMMMMTYIHKVCKCKMVPSLGGNKRLLLKMMFEMHTFVASGMVGVKDL